MIAYFIALMAFLGFAPLVYCSGWLAIVYGKACYEQLVAYQFKDRAQALLYAGAASYAFFACCWFVFCFLYMVSKL